MERLRYRKQAACLCKMSAAPSPVRLPVTYKDRVWHIGHLDQPRQPGRSHGVQAEGTGMAVSECPETWRGIGLLEGDVWVCRPITRPVGKFISYHELSPVQKRVLSRKGVVEGWLVPATRYRAYYEDEDEEPRYEDFDTPEEAHAEYEDAHVETVQGYKASARLDGIWYGITRREAGGFAEELAHLLILEGIGKYDGVWWYDRYIPKLSAPRGVIFQTRRAYWHCVRARTWPGRYIGGGDPCMEKEENQ